MKKIEIYFGRYNKILYINFLCYKHFNDLFPKHCNILFVVSYKKEDLPLKYR